MEFRNLSLSWKKIDDFESMKKVRVIEKEVSKSNKTLISVDSF